MVERDTVVVADWQVWQAQVFVGPRATGKTLALLAQVISSVRFPPQHAGPKQGYGYILGSPSRFPADTITRLAKPQIGELYLVHAPGRPAPGFTVACDTTACTPPGAFYAIAPTFPGTVPALRCSLSLRRSSHEFFCQGSSRRWNRMGLPLADNPMGPLVVLAAKVTWDGQLAIYQDGMRQGWSATAARRRANAQTRKFAALLWPAWRYVG